MSGEGCTVELRVGTAEGGEPRQWPSPLGTFPQDGLAQPRKHSSPCPLVQQSPGPGSHASQGPSIPNCGREFASPYPEPSATDRLARSFSPGGPGTPAHPQPPEPAALPGPRPVLVCPEALLTGILSPCHASTFSPRSAVPCRSSRALCGEMASSHLC